MSGPAIAIDPSDPAPLHEQTLREEGVVEFRQGRGVTVTAAAPQHTELVAKTRELITFARRLGYSTLGFTELGDRPAARALEPLWQLCRRSIVDHGMTHVGLSRGRAPGRGNRPPSALAG